MNTQNKFKLGNWITGNMNKEFYWGQWDCNIFFVEYHDMLYGTDDLKRIRNMYFDKRSGIRLLRDMKLTPNQWLTIRGYKQQDGTQTHTDGDLAVLNHKFYASVYIYFNGAFWSVQENVGLKGFTKEAVEKVNPTWWRKDG